MTPFACPRLCALHRPTPVLALLFALLYAAVLTGPLAAQTRALVHYQKNMVYSLSLADERRLAGDILARAPDTVTLQEVNRNNLEILEMLRPAYPAQHRCSFRDIGGVAVLSRWPLVEGSKRCLEGKGITAIQVEMPEGAVWVMSVHLETPDRPLHGRMVRALAPELAGFSGPKIIGGDFNAFPGSNSVTALARAAGVTPLGPRVVTMRLGGLIGLTIDHVLVTGGAGRVAQLPLIGSDHFGLLARFTLRF